MLEIISAFVRRALATSNCTPAAIFRAIEKWKPTMIVDEGDTFVAMSEELRGILNAGHSRRLAYVLRSEGDDNEPKQFSVWAPKAVALIGKLPATLEDRSIIVCMRRKAKNEKVKRLRLERLFIELRPWREKALRWAADNADRLRQADPATPDGPSDRWADNWRSLIAIAELAGGAWPDLVRDAARAAADTIDNEEVAIVLLGDLKALFAEIGDKIASKVIIERLVAMEERPWGEWGRARKPIRQSAVAGLLKPFGIQPKVIRLGDETARGYDRAACEEAFDRYLAFATPSSPEDMDSEPSQRHNPCGTTVSDNFSGVTEEELLRHENARKPAPDTACDGVTAGREDPGGEGGIGAEPEPVEPVSAWFTGNGADRDIPPELVSPIANVMAVVPDAKLIEPHSTTSAMSDDVQACLADVTELDAVLFVTAGGSIGTRGVLTDAVRRKIRNLAPELIEYLRATGGRFPART